MKNLIVLVTLFFLMSIAVFGNNPDSLKIIELEREIQLLKDGNHFSLGQLLMSGLGLATLLSALFVYLLKKNIDQKIEDTSDGFNKKMQSLVNEREQVVNETFDAVDKELDLCRNKVLYLWGEENNNEVKRILRNVRFNMENVISDEDPERLKKGYDVLFINNTKGTLDETAMLEKIKTIGEYVVVYYYNTTRTRLATENLDSYEREQGVWLKDRINFTTNPAQLYGNLLNTLKYHQLINR